MEDARASQRARFYRRRSFWKTTVLIVAGLFVLYLLLGFFLLPWVIKQQIESRVPELTGRTTTVEKVKANPFLLSVTLENFALAGAEYPATATETTGDPIPPLLHFDRLLIDVSIRSVRHLAPVLDLIRWEGPQINVARLADGRINIEDILERMSEREEPEAPEDEQTIPRFWIDRLEIIGGGIEVRDAQVEPVFVHQLEPIDLALIDLGSLSGDASQGQLEAATAEGARFSWDGDMTLSPLASRGRVVLEQVRMEAFHPYFETVADVALGTSRLSVDITYHLNSGPEAELLTLEKGRILLEALEIAPRNEPESPFFVLQSLEVADIGLRLNAQELAVGQVHLFDGAFRLERDADGEMPLLNLFAAHPSEETAAVPEQPATESPAPWTFALNRFSVQQFRTDYHDASFSQPFAYTFVIEDLALENLSDDLAAPVDLNLSGNLGASGTLSLNGSLTPQPLTGEITLSVEELSLTPFTPVLADFAAIREIHGAAGFEGMVTIAASSETADVPEVSLTGNAVLANLALDQAEPENRILEIPRIEVREITAGSAPVAISIMAVNVLEPRVAVVRSSEGGLNWLELMATEDDGAAAESGDTEAGEDPAADEAFSLTVATFSVRDGQIHFEDQSMDPAVQQQIETLNVTVNDFSLTGEDPVQMRIEAILQENSRLTGEGSWRAADFNDASQLNLTLREFRVPPLSPYAEAFVGRAIANGDLALELNYAVENAQLDGAQSITLNNFELGRETPNEGALNLPIGLAVSLLRDRNGTIQLNVPVSGDLNDPQFDITQVLSSAFGNIVQRAATAPFRMLGSVFGGGGTEGEAADLSFVTFAPGSAELDEANRNKLQTLARALYERPALNLRYRATVPSSDDRTVLARQLLRERLLPPEAGETRAEAAYEEAVAAAYANHQSSGARSSDQNPTAAPERPTLSEDLTRTTGSPASSSRRPGARVVSRGPVEAPSPTAPRAQEEADEPSGEALSVEAMEAALVKQIEVDEADFDRLQRSREQSVRAYLLQAQDIEETRIQPQTEEPAEETAESRPGAVVFEVG